MIARKDGTLLLLDVRMPNELDSDGTGAEGGVGVTGGCGSPESNQEGSSARRSHSGVGGGVGIGFHGSCTRFRVPSELDDQVIGADSGVGGGRREDPPVR